MNFKANSRNSISTFTIVLRGSFIAAEGHDNRKRYKVLVKIFLSSYLIKNNQNKHNVMIIKEVNNIENFCLCCVLEQFCFGSITKLFTHVEEFYYSNI